VGCFHVAIHTAAVSGPGGHPGDGFGVKLVENIWSMAMQQEPIEDGGTYHREKAYFSGLNFREYPQKIWPEIWY